MRLLFVICIVLVTVLGAKLPPSLKKCTLADLDCLTGAVQASLAVFKNGLPEFNIPSIDPLFVPEMTIGAGERVVQLTQKYKNVHVGGLSTAKVSKFNIDLEKGKLEMDLEVAELTFKGKYEGNGKILVLPVNGNGNFLVKLEKALGHLSFDIETITKNNAKYIKGKSASLKLSIAHASYDFENLFNNNKEISAQLNAVLNDNWKEIFDELGPSYSEAYSQVLLQIMNRLFSKVPIEEVFLKQ